jgi:hypothetical protein
MFKSFFWMLRNPFGWHKVRKIILEKEWTREVMLIITEELNFKEHADEHLFLQSIQEEKNEYFKKDLAGRLSEKIISVAESDDEKIALREWVIEIIWEYAPLKVLFSKPEDDSIHPCAIGLNDIASNVLDEFYSEDIKRIGSISDTYEYLRIKSLELNYLLRISNIIRLKIGDLQKDNDWLAQFLGSTVAISEIKMRKKLGLKCPCNERKVEFEQNMMEVNIRSGNDNVFEDVRFAQRFPDWQT